MTLLQTPIYLSPDTESLHLKGHQDICYEADIEVLIMTLQTPINYS